MWQVRVSRKAQVSTIGKRCCPLSPLGSPTHPTMRTLFLINEGRVNQARVTFSLDAYVSRWTGCLDVDDSVVGECIKKPQLSTTRHYRCAKAFTSNPLRPTICHKLQQAAEIG